jgi:hypothetical protein
MLIDAPLLARALLLPHRDREREREKKTIQEKRYACTGMLVFQE